MLGAIHQAVRDRIAETAQQVFGIEVASPVLSTPPKIELGDISTPVCFELAKKLRQPPRKIAEKLAEAFLPLAGVREARVAGGGYLNLFLARPEVAARGYRYRLASGSAAAGEEWMSPAGKEGPGKIRSGKIIVEHTSINPNKAAHIGHLRNAVMGDSLVRQLRYLGGQVEVQNYIDDTGVQVADVVVGFVALEKKSPQDVARLARNEDASCRFDYYCWDLYANVARFYEEDKDRLKLRADALKAIEDGEGKNEAARMGETIATAILRTHLETMQRLDIRYDLLAKESEILRLDFWKTAFELLKKSGVLTFETSGKNEGCWVMALNGKDGEPADESEEEYVKIIVRSNGTVTYVGKDIAYHLWKFGLLGLDFTYRPDYAYPDGRQAWRTAPGGEESAPAFGKGREIYTVIDRRQSYLQNIVAAGLRAMGYPEQAARLYHVAYEVVGLSQRCAQEMGIPLDEETKKRSYVEVSGRKGLGVKADDLIDRLIYEARREVTARHADAPEAERKEISQTIAVGALRYFLLKYTRNSLIVFDFQDALAFEGETGPYLQYTVVRAKNIFRRYEETHPGFQADSLPQLLKERLTPELLGKFFGGKEGDSLWELVALSLQLELVTRQAVDSLESSVLAKYGFRLAQAFNNFYHRHHILTEKYEERQVFLLMLVHLVAVTLTKLLELLGIQVPDRM